MTEQAKFDSSVPADGRRVEDKSAGGLVSDALTHVSSLVRKEVDLARAEVSENVNQAGTAIGLIVGALVIALVALNVLVAAVIAGLVEAGMDDGWAALLVGVVLARVAFGLSSTGIRDLKLSNLAPTRTTKNIQRDAEALKEVYNDR